MMKIKAIIKRPDEEFGHMTNISERLENLQNTVGGYIECVSPDPRIVIICNEEGKLIGLEPNMKIQGDILCGTIIVVGVSGEDFADVPISFEEWKQLVKEWNQ